MKYECRTVISGVDPPGEYGGDHLLVLAAAALAEGDGHAAAPHLDGGVGDGPHNPQRGLAGHLGHGMNE